MGVGPGLLSAPAATQSSHTNHRHIGGSSTEVPRGLGSEDRIDVLEESVPNDPGGDASTLLDAPTAVQIEDRPDAGGRTRADWSEIYIPRINRPSLSTERQGNHDFGTASCDVKRDVKNGLG